MADSETTPNPPLAAAPNAIRPRIFGYYQPSARAEVDKTVTWTMLGGLSLLGGVIVLFVSLKDGLSLLQGGFVTSILLMGFGFVVFKTGFASMKALSIGSENNLQPLDLRKLATGFSPQLADRERQIQVLLEEGEFQKAHTLAEEVQQLAKIEFGPQPESPKTPAKISQSDT